MAALESQEYYDNPTLYTSEFPFFDSSFLGADGTLDLNLYYPPGYAPFKKPVKVQAYPYQVKKIAQKPKKKWNMKIFYCLAGLIGLYMLYCWWKRTSVIHAFNECPHAVVGPDLGLGDFGPENLVPDFDVVQVYADPGFF